MQCPSCGATVLANQVFCGNCGASLLSEKSDDRGEATAPPEAGSVTSTPTWQIPTPVGSTTPGLPPKQGPNWVLLVAIILLIICCCCILCVAMVLLFSFIPEENPATLPLGLFLSAV